MASVVQCYLDESRIVARYVTRVLEGCYKVLWLVLCSGTWIGRGVSQDMSSPCPSTFSCLNGSDGVSRLCKVFIVTLSKHNPSMV
jgi:hypothetical protein